MKEETLVVLGYLALLPARFLGVRHEPIAPRWPDAKHGAEDRKTGQAAWIERA